MITRIKRDPDELERLENAGYMEIANGNGTGFSCNTCEHATKTGGPTGHCAKFLARVDLIRGCCNAFSPRTFPVKLR